MPRTEAKTKTYAKKPNGKNATGAPGKLDALKTRPDFLATVYQLARRGAQYADIAAALQVSEGAVKKWAAEDDEFVAAYKRGKDEFDSGEVESALLKAARGYEYEETDVKSVVLVRGKGEDKITVPAEEVTVKHKKMAPNVGAIVFWLTNRQRDRWQNTRYEKKDVNVKVEAGEVFDLQEVPTEELEGMYTTLGKALAKRIDANSSSADSKKNGISGTA